ncbi:MAG TPA: acyltransferase [Rhodospirillaceae bacterium]|nr:MAG: hypothetical protein A2018_00505 [Alphaproteobacteria bacterium GWF2_58_20]HAU28698.1 acyltransferase [Rhodospirillaceae bacterium]
MTFSPLRFRADINGLRALAVALVLLFHFEVPGFSGGFCGVDVFFVLSGYLMTGILLGRVAYGHATVWDFYLDRTRRILPALAVLCITLLVLGWFFLGPMDYARLGEEVAAAITFVSNILFKGQEGYFDLPSKDKWLLHTWSLAVEWQFYLIYPLVLPWVLRRFGRARLVPVMTGVAAVSFLMAVLTPAQSMFAFYLLPARAWEMLAGGLVFVLAGHLRPSRAPALVLEMLGLAAILASAFLFSGDTPWPSFYAGLPVLGTVLVLLAFRQESVWTGNAVAQALGRWSYSIYLWHWPVVVALGFVWPRLPAASVAFGLGLSLALGFASYALVEQPARKGLGRLTVRRGLSLAVPFMAALALLGMGLVRSGGIPARVSEVVRRLDVASLRVPEEPEGEVCGYSRKTGALVPCRIPGGENRVVVWGDSHAGRLYNAVREATGATVLGYSRSCATLLDTEMRARQSDRACTDYNAKVLAQVDALPPEVPVLIANRFSFYVAGPNEGMNSHQWGVIYPEDPSAPQDSMGRFAHALEKTLCRISENRPVHVLRPIPEMGVYVPQTMLRQAMFGLGVRDVSLPMETYRARHAFVLGALEKAAQACPNVTLLDPVPYLCDGPSCAGSVDGEPLYYDDDHLNITGARRLVPLLRQGLFL